MVVSAMSRDQGIWKQESELPFIKKDLPKPNLAVSSWLDQTKNPLLKLKKHAVKKNVQKVHIFLSLSKPVTTTHEVNIHE